MQYSSITWRPNLKKTKQKNNSLSLIHSNVETKIWITRIKKKKHEEKEGGGLHVVHSLSLPKKAKRKTQILVVVVALYLFLSFSPMALYNSVTVSHAPLCESLKIYTITSLLRCALVGKDSSKSRVIRRHGTLTRFNRFSFFVISKFVFFFLFWFHHWKSKTN